MPSIDFEIIRENEIPICAICGSHLLLKRIDYIERSDGHYVIIRDVPVRECEENGHQFFHASVAKKIERLLELERAHALTPTETLAVPVVEFDMAT